MNKQKLPNEQAVMILGLLSYIGCCCTNGFLGLILSGIGIYLANKSEKILAANPEEYAAGKMNTWKIVNIVSFSISAVFVLIFIYMKVTGKDVEMQEYYMKMLEEMQKGR
jgi:hypothetical protein